MLAVAAAAAAAARYFAGCRCILPCKNAEKTLPPTGGISSLREPYVLAYVSMAGSQSHSAGQLGRPASQPTQQPASQPTGQRASSQSHPAASQPIMNNTQPASSQRASQQAANQQPEPATSQQAESQLPEPASSQPAGSEPALRTSQQPEPASSQPITSSQQPANNEPKMLLQVLLCAYVFPYVFSGGVLRFCLRF